MNGIVFFLVLLAPLSACERRDDPELIGPVVALLEELREDYPEAAESGDGSAEHEEVRAMADELQRRAAKLRDRFSAPIAELRTQVLAGAPPIGVGEKCRALVTELEQAAHLPRAPKQVPDLARGAALYAQACAPCHGPDGVPPEAMVKAQRPPPPGFVESDVMNPLSPLLAYRRIRYGGYGTAMPAFGNYSDDERWAIAFHLFTLRPWRERAAAPRAASLEQLATSTDLELVAGFGESSVGPLRQLRALSPSTASR